MSNPYWIQTYSGLAFDLSCPLPSMVSGDDIAHALATLNRYTGHARWPYSIAQHSLMVADIVAATAPELYLHAAMHDSPEAYINDWSSPLKLLIRERAGEVARNLDRDVERAIYYKFGLHPLTPEQHRLIKHADLVALATEKRDLFGPAPQAGWGDATGFEMPQPLEQRCEEWTWKQARARFREALERCRCQL